MCLLEQEHTCIEHELTLGLKIWRFKMTEMMIDSDPSKLHNNNNNGQYYCTAGRVIIKY